MTKSPPFVALQTDLRKDERVSVLADIGGYNRHEALGRIADLWMWCADRGLQDAPGDCEGYAVPEAVVRRFLGLHGVEAVLGGDVDQFALGVRRTDGLIYLRGTSRTVSTLRGLHRTAVAGGVVRHLTGKRVAGRFVSDNTITPAVHQPSTSRPPAVTDLPTSRHPAGTSVDPDPRSQIPDPRSPFLVEPTKIEQSPLGSCSDARAPAIPPGIPGSVTPGFVNPSEIIRELGYNVRRGSLREPAVEPVKAKPLPVERPSEFVRSTGDLLAELPELAEILRPDPDPEVEPDPKPSITSPETTAEPIPPKDATQPSKVAPEASQVANQTGLSGRKLPSGAARQASFELLSLITRNHPCSKVVLGNQRLREDTLIRWGLTFDKINHIGLMTWEQIRAVMVWAGKDSYWKEKVLGADHLWDFWDNIVADKANKRRGSKGANPTGDAMREYEELRAQEKKASGGG